MAWCLHQGCYFGAKPDNIYCDYHLCMACYGYDPSGESCCVNHYCSYPGCESKGLFFISLAYLLSDPCRKCIKTDACVCRHHRHSMNITCLCELDSCDTVELYSTECKNLVDKINYKSIVENKTKTAYALDVNDNYCAIIVNNQVFIFLKHINIPSCYIPVGPKDADYQHHFDNISYKPVWNKNCGNYKLYPYYLPKDITRLVCLYF